MKRFLVLCGAIGIFIAGGWLWWNNGMKPVNPANKTEKIFVIERGKPIREIGNSLKKEGFIRDAVVFFLSVKKEGKDKSIQAGDYKLSPSMSLPKVIDTLTHGTLDIWVTIPEGLRAEEVGEILKKNFPQYDQSWTEELTKHEGYLFPDTYLIPKDAEVATVVSILKNNFTKKIEESNISQDPSSLSRIIVIASLIEREARSAADKSKVSSVIHNRLNIGMKLDIDATVQYALAQDHNEDTWWKKNLTHQDLAMDSAYNTYKYAALPPAAICNPGIVSIQAAANPDKTNFLYYVSDKAGNLHFAKTFEEHTSNILKYIKR